MLQALRASSNVEPCHPGFPGFFSSSWVWIGTWDDGTGSLAGIPCYVRVKTGRQAPAEAAESVLMFREESVGTRKWSFKSRDPREENSED